jgi:hypothetical protein
MRSKSFLELHLTWLRVGMEATANGREIVQRTSELGVNR